MTGDPNADSARVRDDVTVVTLRELMHSYARLFDGITKGGGPVLVMRYGLPAAMLVPVPDDLVWDGRQDRARAPRREMFDARKAAEEEARLLPRLDGVPELDELSLRVLDVAAAQEHPVPVDYFLEATQTPDASLIMRTVARLELEGLMERVGAMERRAITKLGRLYLRRHAPGVALRHPASSSAAAPT